MRRFAPVVALVLAAAVGYLLVVAIDNAAAATCADYDTQAEAQRAADTRDGDGDGRYCEWLPRSSSGVQLNVSRSICMADARRAVISRPL